MILDKNIEEKINYMGAKIDMIESINNALMSSLLGADCLTQKDAYNFVYLLESRIRDLKSKHDKLIEELKI